MPTLQKILWRPQTREVIVIMKEAQQLLRSAVAIVVVVATAGIILVVTKVNVVAEDAVASVEDVEVNRVAVIVAEVEAAVIKIVHVILTTKGIKLPRNMQHELRLFLQN